MPNDGMMTGEAPRGPGFPDADGSALRFDDPTVTAGLRDAFDRWVTSGDRPLAVPALRVSDGPVPLAEIVRGLRDDHTVLPMDIAGALRLPSAVTYAGAAFLLWWAREARGGPGVRSYRAAVFLLAGLDDGVRDRLLALSDHPQGGWPPAADAPGTRGLHLRELVDPEAGGGSELHGAASG